MWWVHWNIGTIKHRKCGTRDEMLAFYEACKADPKIDYAHLADPDGKVGCWFSY